MIRTSARRGDSRRAGARALLLLLLAAGSAPAGVTSIGDKGVRFTVEAGRYTSDEVATEEGTFRRVRAFGAGRMHLSGRPDLPVRAFWVAVPEAHTAIARVIEATWEDLPGVPIEPAGHDTVLGGTAVVFPAIDRAFYASAAWFPDSVVAVGEPARLRHQTLVPVRVFPFRFQPSSGILRVARSLTVEVTFVPDAAAKRPLRASEPVGNEGAWEDVYRGMILNYDQGRSFRTRAARPLESRAKRLALLPEYKISVIESGLYRIDFSELEKEGLAAGTPISSLALYRRGFSDEALDAEGDPFTEVSIPFHVSDAGADGLFGEGDYLLVYLPGFREDRMKKDTDDRFAYQAIYFLSTEGERAPLEERAAWRGYPGLSPLASYPDSIRWEPDAFYNVEANTDTADLYFPASYDQTSRLTDLSLPAVDPSAPYGVKAMTVSLNEALNPYHRYVLINQAEGDTVFDQVVRGTTARLFGAERTHPAASLVAGPNRFLYHGTRGATPEGNTVEGARGFLDWYEVHANFLYRALDDRLLSSSGGAEGRFQIEAGGFSSPEVFLFDVTHPYRSVRVLPDSVRAGAGAYTVVFQDSSGATKRYAACTAASAVRITSSSLQADRPSDPSTEEGTSSSSPGTTSPARSIRSSRTGRRRATARGS